MRVFLALSITQGSLPVLADQDEGRPVVRVGCGGGVHQGLQRGFERFGSAVLRVGFERLYRADRDLRRNVIHHGPARNQQGARRDRRIGSRFHACRCAVV